MSTVSPRTRLQYLSRKYFAAFIFDSVSLRNACRRSLLQMSTSQSELEAYGQPVGSWEPGLWQKVGSECSKSSLESSSVMYIGPERCPLGLKIKPFMTDEPVSLDDWTEAKYLWTTMIDLMRPVEGDAKRVEFKASLSLIHTMSWGLLKEWWDGKYQDSNLSDAARSFINAGGTLPLSTVRPEASSYHATMFCLFHAELHPTSITTGTPRGLDANRSMALNHATAQKIAYGIYMELAYQPSMYQHPTGAFEGASNSCPWLGDLEGRRGTAEYLPYYLWDTIEKRTIVVANYLREVGIPQYTCISHTWGRWEKKGTPPVKVDGVEDWEIPENTIFDVKRLPSMLSKAQFATRFVWFDLLCIPQDKSNPRYLLEISRQSTIFLHSSACIAWLNDIENWEGLRKTVEFLSMHYLHWSSPSHIYSTDQLLLKATAVANIPSGLYKEDHTLSPWFTSLWTLQEACLCPEIVLSSVDFEQFNVGSGLTITLSQLIQLYDINLEMIEEVTANSGAISNPAEWPSGPRYIKYVKDFVGGDSGVHSRLGILALAQLRQCSERRVEAIMSVMDATDWFTEHVNRYETRPDESDLVLDAYPLKFVKEAARKIGATFYGSLGALKPGGLECQEFGSLLPFSKPLTGSIKTDPGFDHNWYNDVIDHPAVDEWEIMANGSVAIRRAGILCSSDNPGGFSVEARLFIISQATPPGPIAQFHANLDHWLSQVAEGRARIAVSLCKVRDVNSGIILEGRKKSGSLDLVKIGSYDIGGDLELPHTKETNWQVR
jgi:hypothetical protein